MPKPMGKDRSLISSLIQLRDRNRPSLASVPDPSPPSTCPASPPPEYTSQNGSPASSEQDSITSTSSQDGDIEALKTGLKGSEEKKPRLDKPKKVEKISAVDSEKEKLEKPISVSVWVSIQRVPDRRRNCCVLAVVILVILIFCIVFPILWIQHHHGGSDGAQANSTATVTATVTYPQTLTQTDHSTIVSVEPTTVATTAVEHSTLTQTDYSTIVSVEPTTVATTVFEHSTLPPTSLSIPPPKPTEIGGFSVVQYSDDYDSDTPAVMFWVDDNGNIQTLSTDNFGIDPWTVQSKVSSNARVGTALSYAWSDLPEYSNEHLIYADQDYVLQDLVSDVYDDDWSEDSGGLGILGLKTSQSMNFLACAPYRPSADPGSLSDLYLFYNSSEGGIKLAEWANSQWYVSPDPPFSQTGGFAGCDNDFNNNLVAYVVDQNGQLEQWTLNRNLTPPWTLGLQYPGPFSTRTLIQSVTASENPEGRSHIFLQRPDDTLVRLDTHGFGTETSVVGTAEIGLAVRGTRMTAAGNCNTTITLFYQGNNTQELAINMTDSWWNNTVFINSAGTAVIVDQLPFGSVAAAGRVVGVELWWKATVCLFMTCWISLMPLW